MHVTHVLAIWCKGLVTKFHQHIRHEDDTGEIWNGAVTTVLNYNHELVQQTKQNIEEPNHAEQNHHEDGSPIAQCCIHKEVRVYWRTMVWSPMIRNKPKKDLIQPTKKRSESSMS